MPASQKNRPCQLIIDSDRCTGHRRRHRARTARHHVEAGDQPPLPRRIPEGEDLARRHQTAGEADADQHPRHDQLGQRGAKSEECRAEGGDGEQHGLHLAWPVAVERHAPQRLDESGEQEERGGQQPEIGNSDADVTLEVREDHRVDAAEDVRKEIGEGEWQEDLQQQLHVGRAFPVISLLAR
jgi:hypothetical protein